MAASGEEVEDLALSEGVESLSKCCVDLNISVPVGKDSLSMRTKWDDGSAEKVVKSPLSGVITAMAPVADVRNSITPELDTDASSKLVHVALNDKKRLAQSVFSEVTQSNFNATPDLDDVVLFKSMFSSIQEMILNKRILALHDVSDGGLIVSLLEMAFTKKTGLNIQIENLNREDLNDFFFAEEIGLVLQVDDSNLSSVVAELQSQGLSVNIVASIKDDARITISNESETFYDESVISLEKHWRETSHAIQALRDNQSIADSELAVLSDTYH